MHTCVAGRLQADAVGVRRGADPAGVSRTQVFHEKTSQGLALQDMTTPQPTSRVLTRVSRNRRDDQPVRSGVH